MQQHGINITKRKVKMINEKKKETVADFLKRGGKITKVKGGMGSAGKKQVAQFKKKYGVMKKREDELDAKDREEREKNNEELDIAREEAETMNKYVNVLSQNRMVNMWAEAKKGIDLPPVSGKKTLTGKSQEQIKINPKEKGL